MSTLIFENDPASLVDDWKKEGLEYGSIENDLLVQAWDDFHNPVSEFKREGHYEKFKNLVHLHQMTGTFYKDCLEPLNLQVGDTFSLQMTSWIDDYRP